MQNRKEKIPTFNNWSRNFRNSDTAFKPQNFQNEQSLEEEPYQSISETKFLPTKEQVDYILYRPFISYPTVLTCILSTFLWFLIVYLGPYFQNVLPYPLILCICAFISYSQFTVLHESVHNSISQNFFINDFFGFLGCWFLGFLVIKTQNFIKYFCIHLIFI